MVLLPLVSPLRVEVESFVSRHDSFFDTRLSGPDQMQHTTNSHHGQSHTEFKTSDKEINGLQDICVGLWPQELTNHRNGCLDLSGKGTAVLEENMLWVQCLQGTYCIIVAININMYMYMHVFLSIFISS